MWLPFTVYFSIWNFGACEIISLIIEIVKVFQTVPKQTYQQCKIEVCRIFMQEWEPVLCLPEINQTNRCKNSLFSFFNSKYETILLFFLLDYILIQTSAQALHSKLLTWRNIRTSEISAHTDGSSLPSARAKIFRHMCLKSHIRSFGTLGQLLKIPPFSAHSAGGCNPSIFVS